MSPPSSSKSEMENTLWAVTMWQSPVPRWEGGGSAWLTLPYG